MQRFARVVLVTLMPVLALVAGCSDARSPVADANASVAMAPEKALRFSTSPAAGAVDLSQLATYRVPPSDTIGFIRQYVYPNRAASLRFPGGFGIDVPAGAVDKGTWFEIRVRRSQTIKNYVFAEFSPHQYFLRPVTVIVPVRNTTAEGSPTSVLWWNDASNSWVNVGGKLTADGVSIAAEVPHFTVYGTASPAPTSGGMTQIGYGG